MVLVDTSVWIEVFRKEDPLDLESVVSLNDVVTCLPVIQEILQGFREERAFRVAREALHNLPIVESPLSIEIIEEAVNLYRTARRNGITVRSSIDCLISACAIRNDLEVLHHDLRVARPSFAIATAADLGPLHVQVVDLGVGLMEVHHDHVKGEGLATASHHPVDVIFLLGNGRKATGPGNSSTV